MPRLVYITLLASSSMIFFSSLSAVPSPSEISSPVAITLTADPVEAGPINPRFLGLSYESSMLLPVNGTYYFNDQDSALIHTFQTLGIKSLRVGANAVDSAEIPVPQEKDIDSLFKFARAAGVKVIYSFRLQNGNPEDSARLARYIYDHYADVLDCVSIGNEPNCYIKNYQDYKSVWMPHYDAILKAVPQATFDGPSTNDGHYEVAWAHDFYPLGHVAMASNHFYFLGSGRNAEKDIPGTQTRFLSNKILDTYQTAYSKEGAVFEKAGIPYRIDEANNCYNGGCKGVSNTYAAALWALDISHWLALHHVLGINFHTGEKVGMNGGFSAPNYAAFVRQPSGSGFNVHPVGYGYMAFSQGAHGHPIHLSLQTATPLNVTAYGYQDAEGTDYLTVINKTFGTGGKTVSVNLPAGWSGTWERMDLTAPNHDIAAESGVTLGGGSIDPQGQWAGQWQKFEAGPQLSVDPSTAVLLRCMKK